MDNSPLISVVVPVYKVEKYLDRCVESIVDQTYSNLEIILVDDGSPDNCPAMCDAWAEKDSRIKVIHKENGGLSDARNAGMKVATGEYIAFVDSDDWVDTGFLETLYKVLKENSCDIAECGFLMTSGIVELPESTGAVTVCTAAEAMELHLRNKMFQQVVWNKLYHRSVITVQFEKGKYHEDEFWTYQIIGNCKSVAHVDKSMYFYYQRPGSIMGEVYSLRRLDALEGKEKRLKYIKEFYPELSERSKVDLYFGCIFNCQRAIQTLNTEERKQATSVLLRILKTCNLSKEEIEKLKFTHRCWIQMSRVNLLFTCRLRNMLKIGL